MKRRAFNTLLPSGRCQRSQLNVKLSRLMGILSVVIFISHWEKVSLRPTFIYANISPPAERFSFDLTISFSFALSRTTKWDKDTLAFHSLCLEQFILIGKSMGIYINRNKFVMGLIREKSFIVAMTTYGSDKTDEKVSLPSSNLKKDETLMTLQGSKHGINASN